MLALRTYLFSPSLQRLLLGGDQRFAAKPVAAASQRATHHGSPPRRMFPRRARSVRQSLQCLDDFRRGGCVDPVRTDKCLDESTTAGAVDLRIAENLVQLFDVLAQ